jgi:hypothetical protein
MTTRGTEMLDAIHMFVILIVFGAVMLFFINSQNNFIGMAVPPGVFGVAVDATNGPVGSLIPATISIGDAGNVAGIQMTIIYNSSLLRYDHTAEGSFFSQGGAETHFLDTINSTTPGLVQNIIIVRIGGGASGNGNIATAYFNATGAGTSSLRITSLLLSDENGTSLSAGAYNTTVQITAVTMNGVCGASNGAITCSAPTTGLCSIGTSTSVASNATTHTWRCLGISGGLNASCSASRGTANGACGSSSGASFYTKPTANLCSVGTNSSLSGSGPWSWSCIGSCVGSNSSCSAALRTDGVCGTSNGVIFCTSPSVNLCGGGTNTSIITNSTTFAWRCIGINGGLNVSCGAGIGIVNGACGVSNGNSYYTKPIVNLCSSGINSSVAGSGPWTWSCGGNCSGTNSSCSASLRSDGKCGPAARSYSQNESAFSGVLCNSSSGSLPASPTFPASNSSSSWGCLGANGGINESCTASKGCAANFTNSCGSCGIINCSGSCVSTAVCSIGAKQCSGAVAQICNSTCGWEDAEDCSLKASIDSDGSIDAYTISGTVINFTECTAGACTNTSYTDSCSGTVLTEFGANGPLVSSQAYDCKNYPNATCNGTRLVSTSWVCLGNPGYCSHDIAADSLAGTDLDNDGVDNQCGDNICDSAQGVWDSTRTGTESACSDSLDNDCDNLTDCSDPECTPTSACTGGTSGGSGSSGGGSHGGGNSGGALCVESWNCSAWDSCSPKGFSYRTCTDKNKCSTVRNKPEESSACVYHPNCIDGLMNGNEEGIDCGGICTNKCSGVIEAMQTIIMEASPIESEILTDYKFRLTVSNIGVKELSNLKVQLDKWISDSKTIDYLAPGERRELVFDLYLPSTESEILTAKIFADDVQIAGQNFPVNLNIPDYSMSIHRENGKVYAVTVVDNRNLAERKVNVDYDVSKRGETYLIETDKEFNVPENQVFTHIEALMSSPGELPAGTYMTEAVFRTNGKVVGETHTSANFEGRSIFNAGWYFYGLMMLIVIYSLWIYYKAYKER